jgi:hypothetical protein
LKERIVRSPKPISLAGAGTLGHVRGIQSPAVRNSHWNVLEDHLQQARVNQPFSNIGQDVHGKRLAKGTLEV